MAAPISIFRGEMSKLLADFRALRGEVEATGVAVRKTTSEVTASEQTLGRSAAAAQTALAALASSSSATRAQVEGDSRSLGIALDGAAGRVESAAAKVTSSSGRARETADEAAAGVAQAADRLEEQEPRLTRMEELLQRMHDRGNAQLQSLLDRLSEFEDAWSPTIAEQLELVELGVLKLDEFLRKWGDAQVATEAGSVRLRELLDQLDPDVYVQQIADLVRALREGEASISQAIEFLKSKNGEYAQSLAELLQKVLDGKATIEDLRRRAEALEQLFPGSALADLADQLADEADQAYREGRL